MIKKEINIPKTKLSKSNLSIKQNLASAIKIFCAIFLFTLNFNFNSYCQTNLSSNNKNNFEYYFELAEQYKDSIGNKGFYYANQALKLAEKENDNSKMIEALILIAEISKENGNWENSLESLNTALELSKQINDPDLLHSIYLDLGIIYKYLNETYLAIEYYNKALKQAEKQNNCINQAMCLNNIANIYLGQSNFSKALHYYKQTLKLFKESKTDANSHIIVTLNNIAVANMALENFEEARSTLLEAIELSGDSKSSIRNQLYTNLCATEIKLKNYAQAEKYAQISENILNTSDDKKARLNLYEKIFYLYNEQKNYTKAIDYQTKYIQLKDSMYTDNLSQSIGEYKTKYELDKLEVENLIKNKELENKKKINNFLVIVILLISTLFILLINYFIKSKLLNKKLNNLNTLLQTKNQEIKQNLKYSKQIQLSLIANKALPNNVLILDLPKDEVGGDFFIYRNYFDSEIFILGDCTGHGSSGALLSIFSINTIDQILNQKLEINEILNQLNNRFLTQISKSEYLKGESLSITIIQKTKDSILYSGSKQKLWKFDNLKKEIFEFKTDNIIIGREENKSFCLNKLSYNENDIIFISSDGYPDQFGDDDKGKLKYQKFREILKIWSNSKLDNTEILKNEFLKWKGETEQTDDVLVVAIKF
ncbi:MAG TPA: tetratricopeptide repeat protein [Bacteroidales bacterium]|nr:tetratricopeptide repeat protein [Bacteroidales bacterium]HQB21108.1 tetratricopeptide repeat protein [Bacteroidales bacterium]